MVRLVVCKSLHIFDIESVYFQRCAPASIRLVDNEQFQFGKFKEICFVFIIMILSN